MRRERSPPRFGQAGMARSLPAACARGLAGLFLDEPVLRVAVARGAERASREASAGVGAVQGDLSMNPVPWRLGAVLK